MMSGRSLLLLLLALGAQHALAQTQPAAPPMPPNTALVAYGGVEFVVLGGFVGYLDLTYVSGPG
jgi:hypothetical protein